jgi:hypothetical protein
MNVGGLSRVGVVGECWYIEWEDRGDSECGKPVNVEGGVEVKLSGSGAPWTF